MSIYVSLIIPTYNEILNIVPLIARLRMALVNYEWEIVFVDDNSPDGTSSKILQEAAHNVRARLISRIGRRGLSSACIEGVLAASFENIVIMDADMQHDESIIPKMLDLLDSQDLDLVIGSRYITGGGVGSLDYLRVVLSKSGAVLTRMLTGTPVQDPLSGFFAVKKEYFINTMPFLYGKGFKILLDLIMSSQRTVRIVEIPFVFRARLGGKTKLTVGVLVDLFLQIVGRRLQGKHPKVFIG